MDLLVSGRECGNCTQCCIVPAIDKPDIQKQPGAVCAHCAERCEIYAERPQVCRNYYCGWRRLAIFDESWRPDKSGVFAEVERQDIPARFGPAIGISLTLVANPLKTVRQPWFVDFVASGVNRNIPLFLGLPGPRGFLGAKLLLNDDAMLAAARRARGPVKDELEKALKRLSAHRFVPNVMVHDGNDVSGRR